MPEVEEPISTEAAEKAYEAAAASAVAMADTVAEPAPKPLEFPARTERAATPVKAKPITARKAPPMAKAPKAVQPVKKVAAPKPKTPKAKPAAKSTFATKPAKFIKETIMPAKKTATKFVKTVKTAAAEVQAKAKLAYAKGSEVLGDATEFTKGNVEAVVTSGKILGAGLQELGKTYAAEGKATFDTVTSDVKKISEVKSPVEFVQAQSEILRRNFDHAINFNAKTSETMIGLLGSAFAPLSARASLVVEKVKKAA